MARVKSFSRSNQDSLEKILSLSLVLTFGRPPGVTLMIEIMIEYYGI